MYKLIPTYLKVDEGSVNGIYNLRSQSDFRIPGVNTVFYIENSISYLGPVIQNSLPADLKKHFDFDLFKSTIRKWKPVDCSFRLLKHYLTGFSLINVPSQPYYTVYVFSSCISLLYAYSLEKFIDTISEISFYDSTYHFIRPEKDMHLVRNYITISSCIFSTK